MTSTSTYGSGCIRFTFCLDYYNFIALRRVSQPHSASGRFSPPPRMPPLGFSLELDEGNISRQFCVSCTGSPSKDVSTSNWHALSSRHCPARHLRTWLTTYISSRKVLDVGSAHPPTDRVPFHAHTNTFGDRSIAAAWPRVWNSLPSHLREEDITYNSFRC